MTSQKRPVVMWLDFKQGVESERYQIRDDGSQIESLPNQTTVCK